LVESREKAQAVIMAGEVLLNGQKALKPSQMVDEGAIVEVTAKPRYVSRGGLKLEAALQSFAISVEQAVCADFGTSTGGFTDCLLQAGAARVHAIDTGTGQIDWRLRNDLRVVLHEGVNARHLDPALIGEKVALAVCDVSFISATLIIPAMDSILRPDGQIIVLVKPQFEVGRGLVDKGGIVRDPELHQAACEKVRTALEGLGFQTRIAPSPITGAEGNREFLLHGRR
jgi:23S rRNA (cytidine1920-2'-O)/16S rRNA (cytidine1409-2'-O)-methyltransferase